MKKSMIITLVTGQVIEKDLIDFIKNAQSDPRIQSHDRLPLNAPADHPVFQGLMQFTLTNGLEEPGTRSNKYFGFIAPSQIKSVAIVFSEKA